MRVIFFSNYLNHHQLPFCLAMDRLTNGHFTFVATAPVPQARLTLGYHDMNKEYPFVLTTYDSEENKAFAMALALNSDVAIIGSAPWTYAQKRMKQNKLTFCYTERLFKKGLHKALSPKTMINQLIHHTCYANKPLYMLCASAYAAFDFALSGAYVGKTYKWGYFPEFKKQEADQLFARKQAKKTVSILWVARLIELKHPEVPIQIAEKLKAEGYTFEVNIIGRGPMEKELQEMISRKRLDDCVHMLGAMSPENVREQMEMADIFLFTSDFNEGWGAVLNEAMNSGCAVVASHAIGSVPFLKKKKKNGFIYKNGDTDSLYKRVVQLIKQPQLREQMGNAAYHTLEDLWNADMAAERLIELAQALLDGKSTKLFADGPCSKARILSNWWYRNA